MDIIKKLSILIFCSFLSSTIAIFGGDEATRHQFPFMASLRRFEKNIYRHDCGASIISDRFLLTAAHCNQLQLLINLDRYRISVGIHARNEEGELYQLEKFINHPNYSLVHNDIALVLLKERIRFSAHVSAIEIGRDFITGNRSAIASGWGMSEVCYIVFICLKLNPIV